MTTEMDHTYARSLERQQFEEMGKQVLGGEMGLGELVREAQRLVHKFPQLLEDNYIWLERLHIPRYYGKVITALNKIGEERS